MLMGILSWLGVTNALGDAGVPKAPAVATQAGFAVIRPGQSVSVSVPIEPPKEVVPRVLPPGMRPKLIPHGPVDGAMRLTEAGLPQSYRGGTWHDISCITPEPSYSGPRDTLVMWDGNVINAYRFHRDCGGWSYATNYTSFSEGEPFERRAISRAIGSAAMGAIVDVGRGALPMCTRRCILARDGQIGMWALVNTAGADAALIAELRASGAMRFMGWSAGDAMDEEAK